METNNQGNDHELYGRLRLGLLIIAVFVGTILGRACGSKREDPKKEIKVSGKTKIQLKSDNGTKPSDGQHIPPKEKYIPPEGKVTITPKDPSKSLEDVVKIHYQEIGFVFEPGIEFSGNLYYSYGIDAKLAYAYHFGFGAGVVTGSNVVSRVCPGVFISYRINKLFLRNTEAIFTYIPVAKIPFGLGIRINL